MDLQYTTKLKIKRNPAIMHGIYHHYVQTGLTLNYTCACIFAALSGSR